MDHKWYRDLYQEVISHICVLCGTCVAACPVDALGIIEEKSLPSLVGKCIRDGSCYRSCPRGGLDYHDIEREMWGDVFANKGLGRYTGAYTARSMLPVEGSQAGGVVTEMVVALLESDEVDAVVLSPPVEERLWKSEPMVATTSEEVRRAAGSRYTQAHVNSAVKQAIRDYERVAVVGNSCEVEGLRAMMLHNTGNFNHVEYILGLFCFENYQDRFYDVCLTKEEQVNLERITRIDITSGYLSIFWGPEEIYGVKCGLIRDYAMPGCRYCDDFTNRQADVSIGAVGSETGYSTVLVRTPAGKHLWDLTKDGLKYRDLDNPEAVQKVAKTKQRIVKGPIEVKP